MKDLRGLCASATSALLFARYNLTASLNAEATETQRPRKSFILHPSSLLSANSNHTASQSVPTNPFQLAGHRVVDQVA
jgi:hypothetical protein